MFPFEFPLPHQELYGVHENTDKSIISEHLMKFFTLSFFPSETIIVCCVVIIIIRQSQF